MRNGFVEPSPADAFDKHIEMVRNRRASMTTNLDWKSFGLAQSAFASAKMLKIIGKTTKRELKKSRTANLWELCARSTSDRAQFQAKILWTIECCSQLVVGSRASALLSVSNG
jgi:hypothetical protein